jgi:hypothetical protein
MMITGMPLLAHGESAILPGLLLLLVLYPASICTLAASLKGVRSTIVTSSGAIIAAVGALGCVAVLKLAPSATRDGSEANLLGGFGLWIASTLFGILLAVIAWVRRERCPVLPLLGVLLSLGPLVFGVVLLIWR